MPNKPQFLLRIIKHRLASQPRSCPFCQSSTNLTLIKKKAFVLDIIRCESCKLIFRWPADSEGESHVYYEHFYSESHPEVKLPSASQLKGLIDREFAATQLDLRPEITLLKAIKPQCRVLDYGCSWGYGTHQLIREGFDAVGFEISQRRAAYGREKLHLNIISNIEGLKSLSQGSFAVIFSHHVIEHLQDIRSAFQVMSHLLAKDGLMFHVLPNFTGKLARTGMWLKWIGEEHPLAPTVEFFSNALPLFGFLNVCFGSSPFDQGLARTFENSHRNSGQLEGDELLCLAFRNTEVST